MAIFSPLMSKTPSNFLLLLVLILKFCVLLLVAQQAYVRDNHQLDCGNRDPDTKGYVCNGVQSSCQSYITFRSNPPYNSPATISYLLGDTKAGPAIASINNISSDIAIIPDNTQVIIPVRCSCYKGLYYQHNSTYILKDENENYFTLANNTYQGLTTCQVLQEQNPYDLRNLYAGMNINVPLRCACPTQNQTGSGAKYLVTYMVTWGDYIEKIAEMFNANEQSVLDANGLLEEDVIYPFTPILVPLSTEPSKIELPRESPTPTRSPPLEVVPVGKPKTSKKWVFVGVGSGVALLLLVCLSATFLIWNNHRHRLSQKAKASVPEKTLPGITSSGVELAIESLAVYKFVDIQNATGFFSEENRIKGTVYSATFEGDKAAVKVMKGDVSSEINILKKINHFNIIKLSGFCVHEGNTYLVYEYAENGSLDNLLHSCKDPTCSPLSCKQIIQIAYDVADAINYLHNFTNPPFVHKNLKTSNILIVSNLRARIANFGLARMLTGDDKGLFLTRHVIGTHGYMAPEYIENGLITPKLDVFAYGVVVLELLSGKPAVISEENGQETLLVTLITAVLEGENVRRKLLGFINPSCREEFPLHLAFSLAQLAKNCVAHDLNARPAMDEVVATLSKMLSSLMD